MSVNDRGTRYTLGKEVNGYQKTSWIKYKKTSSTPSGLSTSLLSKTSSVVEGDSDKYQKKYDIVNRPDKEKESGRPTALFFAVNHKDKEACFNITKLLLNNGRFALRRG